MYTSLQQIINDSQWVIPEIILVLTMIFLIGSDLIFGNRQINTLLITGGIALALYFTFAQFNNLGNDGTMEVYNGLLQVSAYSIYGKVIILFGAILVILFALLSQDFKFKNQDEFYYLFIGVVLGLLLLLQANNYLMLFVSLETVSILSYILTVFKFDKQGAEAGIKYVLFGAFAAALSLYGISFWYGYTGSLDFPSEILIRSIGGVSPNWLVLILVLSISGVLFKISAFPFHFWTPDVYQGAPLPFTAFLSTVPKAVALLVLVKFIQPLLAVNEIAAILTWIIALIAFFTLLIGNFSALSQNNLKRLLAYSSIGQAGYLLMLVIGSSELTITALFFYLVVYVLMNFSAFILLDVFGGIQQTYDVNNFKGLGMKMPLLGGIFVIVMIALTGLPPTAGFYAKLLLFTAVWESYQVSQNSIYVYLLVTGLINTVVSLFYYLKIPYYLFLKKADNEKILTSLNYKVMLLIVLISLPLVILFLSPNWMVNLFENIKL